ncbi:MAG: molybdopterin-dependent oxidoreductase [Geodermatophilaceae bacterium]|nr:molybdopterin-dependent oxidoreductase [Geodermatophilaceae bacterium]
MTIRELIPRRLEGLPPGQRHVRAFPRFSDNPLRPAPPIEPIALTVSVDGDPIHALSSDDLGRLEQVDQVSDFHCVTTWTYRGARWGGVRFTELAATLFDGATPRYLTAHAADRMSAIYITQDLDKDNVLLATRLDGHPLDQRHGAPLRLVSPDQYGYKNIKHLVGLDFRHEEPSSTLGPKEHLRARVATEERHSTLPNWAVRTPYRLLIIPTALAAERSLHSSPR